MSNIVDLNIIFPKEKVVSFEALDGVVYNITISIPNKLALRFIQLSKEREKEGRPEMEIAIDLAYELMVIYYPETTKEWIEKNMPWKYITYIVKAITEEVFGSMEIIEKSVKQGEGNTEEKK